MLLLELQLAAGAADEVSRRRLLLLLILVGILEQAFEQLVGLAHTHTLLGVIVTPHVQQFMQHVVVVAGIVVASSRSGPETIIVVALLRLLIGIVSVILVQQPFEDAVAVAAFAGCSATAAAAAATTTFLSFILAFDALDDAVDERSEQAMTTVHGEASCRLWSRRRSVTRFLHEQNPQPTRLGYHRVAMIQQTTERAQLLFVVRPVRVKAVATTGKDSFLGFAKIVQESDGRRRHIGR